MIFYATWRPTISQICDFVIRKNEIKIINVEKKKVH